MPARRARHGAGLLRRQSDRAALRGLDGTPAPAEARDDVFVALDNRTGGEAYGPVVVLPHGVVRFTSQLTPAFEGELCTLLASAQPLETIESGIVALARHGRAGHALVVSRSDVRLSVADTVLVLKLAAREEHVELDAPAAERARRYLRRSEASP